MRNRLALIFLSLLLVPGVFVATPVSADDVYLTNGKSFENVIADVTETHVRIIMPAGEIKVPRASVSRVEAGHQIFSQYLQRKEQLGRNAKATDWLELAQWARSNGFDQGAKEAALKAAELDPRLPGLAGLLRPFGYVFDARLDRFISYADSMRQKGYVQSNGQWITREESAQLEEERQERSARLAAQEAVEANRRAVEAQLALAELQLQQAQAAGQSGGIPYDGGLYLPGLGYGGYLGSSFNRGHHGGFHSRTVIGGISGGSGGAAGGPWRPGGQHFSQGYQQLVGRVPGSLFPVGGTRH